MGLGVPTPSAAQDRRIVTIDDADFFGGDYRTVKDVDLEACKRVCLADQTCRAFTFNTSAGWCFLKANYGQLQGFQGAVAGRVVEVSQPRETQEADRKAEVAFLDSGLIDRAATYARRVGEQARLSGQTVDQLRRNGQEALAAKNAELAEQDFAGVLALEPEDFAAWSQLAEAQLAQNPQNWQDRQTKRDNAVSSAINAYMRAITESERVWSLELLSRALAKQDNWKPAIKSLRLALTLEDRTDLRRRYDQMIARHGFRIVSHEVDADTAAPRICLVFSDRLASAFDYGPYVSVQGPGTTAIEAEGNQVCIDGANHGARYEILARSGLPAADGEKLEKSASLSVYVRDRSPTVYFMGRSYVLPAGGDPTIPIVSVNTTEVEASIYRIGDRALAATIRDGKFLRQIGNYQSDQIEDDLGEKVWSGIVETENELNAEITTAIPISETGIELKPGIYAMTARSKLDIKDQWGPLATQWFLVSDLGLASYTGDNGLTVNVRSLTSAEGVVAAKVRLVAVSNEILGETETGSDGFARFEPGLLRGRGGMAPGLLVVETDTGDYSFLDLKKPSFDLSDRGVEGRPAPGPIDVFAWTDRGIYKASDTVHMQVLMRTAKAAAQSDLPMTIIVYRPDGVEHLRQVVQDSGLGGHFLDLELSATAQQGTWSFAVHLSPDDTALTQKTFMVEDYQPERVDFDLETEAAAFSRTGATSVSLTAAFLYGAPASGQSLEGDIIVRPSRALMRYPGYVFGLSDLESYPSRNGLPEGLTTDSSGALNFEVTLPDLPETTALYEGELVTRLVEAGGRYVERRLELPVAGDAPKIGIKPAFDGGVDEGGPAEFDVIVINAAGERISGDGLSWTLSQLDRRYQWYRTDGRWAYEPITLSRRVANGEVNVSAGQPARLSLPVEWGRYRLEILGEGAIPVATSTEFSAGWYSADASSETPDYLEVGLDKKTYQPGETALLRLTTQAPGIASISVLAGGLVSTQTVEVTGETAEIEIPVTQDWGAGAYVTASLYRPMDLAQSQMPARAIGLSWLQLDPQDRVLDIALSAPDRILPSTTLDVPVEISNLPDGADAYVTLAAVDIGILNLTGFETPDPDAWYFGQRRLGTDIRDLYGLLIDRTAGSRGRVRSGGDAGAMRLDAPPPEQEPVALFSGPVKLDGAGKATVSFEIPEFNGAIRLMAVAWSADGVGHSEADVEVRSPVVITASGPSVLAPGDSTRVLFDIDNVDGPEGSYSLEIVEDGPVAAASLTADAAQFSLGAGGRQQISLPVSTRAGLGSGEVTALLTAPDGEIYSETLRFDVRDPSPNVVRRSSFALNQGESLLLDSNITAGLRPETAKITLTTGGAARIDVAGLLEALDRYPYGCTEQTTSRALPLLYLNEVAEAAGLGQDAAIRERVTEAIGNVLANQSAGGTFGLWNSYGGGDLWLDAYIADFLTRALEQGYRVAETAFSSALDNLENRVAYTTDVNDGGEGVAYALYVLARNGRASMGDLRYYIDAQLDAFGTPLAKAQLGAAIALYGEGERAQIAFSDAVASLGLRPDNGTYSDYGSALRDGAGVLTYAASTPDAGAFREPATRYVRDAQQNRSHFSTQDMAWMLLAADGLNTAAADDAVTINGETETGRLIWDFTGEQIANEQVRAENTGQAAADMLVSVSGQPLTPEPEVGRDYAIERTLYDLEGTPLPSSSVPLNTRIAVVVTVRALSDTPGRLMIVDRIPAGLAIDNPRLVRSGDLGGLDFLATIDQPEHAVFKADRFEVAVDETRSGGDEMHFAYLARAVTPGDYLHPAASVEDMYRPDRRANTATGRMTILDRDR
ncbi:alpha-2-macroglobulin [Roseibium hamelinense]|nr:alpha-2-macroglobulin [Roseibium hamelinense]